MDTPPQSPDSDNINDLDSFRARRQAERSGDELDPEALNDVDFAQYRLAVWAHPSALAHIIDSITRDLIEADASATPSLERLRRLMTDPRFDEMPINQDPYAENFDRAVQLATADAQVFALKAVQRLHIVTVSSELVYAGTSNHIRHIVEAILHSDVQGSI